jgi:hypothetical protein
MEEKDDTLIFLENDGMKLKQAHSLPLKRITERIQIFRKYMKNSFITTANVTKTITLL